MTAPHASVVIPTHGRPRELDACLQALAAQRCRFPFEVVVVDDGSPAPVAPEIGSGLDLRVVRTFRSGPAAARNAGVAAARGRLLAFTDDDCRPEVGWLEHLDRALSERPEAIVAGTVVNGLPDNLFAEASQSLVTYLLEHYRGARTARFFTSNNIAMLRQTFDALGGFDERFMRAAAEDRELCLRANDRDVPVLIDPQARVVHHHDLDARRFLRQHLHYGRGARRLHLARRGAGCGHRVEPLSFYTRLAMHPLAGGASGRALLLTGLMLASQAALVTGYLLERLARTPRTPPAPVTRRTPAGPTG